MDQKEKKMEKFFTKWCYEIRQFLEGLQNPLIKKNFTKKVEVH